MYSKLQGPFSTQEVADMQIKLALAVFASVFLWVCASLADERREYTIQYKDGDFEDVFQDLQDAIVNQGLVIDYIGHVNKMLERTASVSSQNTGSATKTPYLNAKYVLFCSSALTHEAVGLKPQNLATCPFVIFVYQTYERPDRVAIGYRNPEMGMPGPTRFVMEKVKLLLETIVDEAMS